MHHVTGQPKYYYRRNQQQYHKASPFPSVLPDGNRIDHQIQQRVEHACDGDNGHFFRVTGALVAALGTAR